VRAHTHTHTHTHTHARTYNDTCGFSLFDDRRRGALVFIDPPASEGQGRRVICQRAAKDSVTRTLQTELTDHAVAELVNEGHEGVHVGVRAELTLLGCI